MRASMLMTIVLAGSTLLAAPAETREEAVAALAEKPAPKEWRATVSLYGWLTGFSVDAGGQRINASFGDVLDLLNAGAMLRASGRWRRWTGYVDYLYADLGDASEIGRATAELDVVQHNVDFRVGYVAFERPDVEVIVEAGARWWYTRTTVSIDIPPLLPGGGGASDEVRESSSWWDPLVGVRVRWRISERALLTAHVNAGGFGWGEASDSVWDLGLVLSIRVWKGLSIPLGYRVLTYERSDDGLDLDTTMQGPIVGVSFTF